MRWHIEEKRDIKEKNETVLSQMSLMSQKKYFIQCGQSNSIDFSASKPLYDKTGRLVSDQTDRCDCNRLKCPGCFLACSNCHSSKCGLECRKKSYGSIPTLMMKFSFT